jgi:hypothetical protein
MIPRANKDGFIVAAEEEDEERMTLLAVDSLDDADDHGDSDDEDAGATLAVSLGNPQDDDDDAAAGSRKPGTAATTGPGNQDSLVLSKHGRLRSRKDALVAENAYPPLDIDRSSTGTYPNNQGSKRLRDSIFSCQRNRIQCMAAALLWCTVVSLAVTVVWYSYELFNHGYVVRAMMPKMRLRSNVPKLWAFSLIAFKFGLVLPYLLPYLSF